MALALLALGLLYSKDSLEINETTVDPYVNDPEQLTLKHLKEQLLKGDRIADSGYAGATGVFKRRGRGIMQPTRLFIDNYAMDEKHLSMINPDYRQKFLNNPDFVKKYRNGLADAYNIGSLSTGWIHPFLDPKIMSRRARMNPPPRVIAS